MRRHLRRAVGKMALDCRTLRTSPRCVAVRSSAQDISTLAQVAASWGLAQGKRTSSARKLPRLKGGRAVWLLPVARYPAAAAPSPSAPVPCIGIAWRSAAKDAAPQAQRLQSARASACSAGKAGAGGA